MDILLATRELSVIGKKRLDSEIKASPEGINDLNLFVSVDNLLLN